LQLASAKIGNYSNNGKGLTTLFKTAAVFFFCKGI